MTLFCINSPTMSSELEHHLSDLSAEADSVLDEAHRLLLDFHPANTSNNYSATDESENQSNSMGAAMVIGNHSNSNVDEDSDIEEIVQEIPVVSLLDSTIDVGPLPDAQTVNAHDSQDDDIIFVQETVNTDPITIDLCSDSFIGPTHSTPNARRRALSSAIGAVFLDNPFTDEIPSRRRRLYEPPLFDVALETLSVPAIDVSEATPQTRSHPRQEPKAPKAPKYSPLDVSRLSQSNSSAPLKCPICLESCAKNQPSSTICGHVFCKACIEQCIRQTKQCPMCKKRLTVKNVHRLYL